MVGVIIEWDLDFYNCFVFRQIFRLIFTIYKRKLDQVLDHNMHNTPLLINVNHGCKVRHFLIW